MKLKTLSQAILGLSIVPIVGLAFHGKTYTVEGSAVTKVADIDLAELKFTSNENYTPVEIGNSSNLIAGSTVYINQQPSTEVSGSTATTKDAEEFFREGNDKFNKSDYRGAIALYDQAIRLNPNYADAYYNRGLAHYDLGDQQGAIADYTQAIQINPNYANVYYGRGLASYKSGDKQGAIADFQKAASLYQQQGNQDYYQRSLERIRTIQQ